MVYILTFIVVYLSYVFPKKELVYSISLSFEICWNIFLPIDFNNWKSGKPRTERNNIVYSWKLYIYDVVLIILFALRKYLISIEAYSVHIPNQLSCSQSIQRLMGPWREKCIESEHLLMKIPWSNHLGFLIHSLKKTMYQKREKRKENSS